MSSTDKDAKWGADFPDMENSLLEEYPSHLYRPQATISLPSSSPYPVNELNQARYSLLGRIVSPCTPRWQSVCQKLGVPDVIDTEVYNHYYHGTPYSTSGDGQNSPRRNDGKFHEDNYDDESFNSPGQSNSASTSSNIRQQSSSENVHRSLYEGNYAHQYSHFNRQ